MGHRQTFAALWLLGEGRREEQAEEGKDRQDQSRHNAITRCAFGESVSSNLCDVMRRYGSRANPPLASTSFTAFLSNEMKVSAPSQ